MVKYSGRILKRFCQILGDKASETMKHLWWTSPSGLQKFNSSLSVVL